ncbi:uncharacterized protein I303_101258 [Kwoniella dejecticola CBS 10117]|uniref:Uncharacterized protein n=1 Tax=Kwoniella dejecticola CBS 10117 TaxID=1296121 RepID=A0AAJ8MEE9_9TREE
MVHHEDDSRAHVPSHSHSHSHSHGHGHGGSTSATSASANASAGISRQLSEIGIGLGLGLGQRSIEQLPSTFIAVQNDYSLDGHRIAFEGFTRNPYDLKKDNSHRLWYAYESEALERYLNSRVGNMTQSERRSAGQISDNVDASQDWWDRFLLDVVKESQSDTLAQEGHESQVPVRITNNQDSEFLLSNGYVNWHYETSGRRGERINYIVSPEIEEVE